MRYKIIKLNTMLEKKTKTRVFFSLQITNIKKKNLNIKSLEHGCSHNHLAKDPSIYLNIELDMRSQVCLFQ